MTLTALTGVARMEAIKKVWNLFTGKHKIIKKTRAVIVVDRGWIFAGDVTRENGRIKLDNAVWVFKWESIGFDGVIANPNDKKVLIRQMPNGIDIPAGAEIYSVSVEDGWGLSAACHLNKQGYYNEKRI
jgi:hypothetical protein